jgi:hypothetical protein
LEEQQLIIRALRPVVQAFDALNIEFYIGGSVASSYHGVGRSTLDVDLVADLSLEHVTPLIVRLGDEYYADADMIRDAIRGRSSFNLIHFPTSYKVDVFVMSRRPFEQSARQRIVRGTLPADSSRDYPLASAEDTILNKLEWFRSGGEVSERQWKDIIGVMKVQAGALDLEYLYRWAPELGVMDLLERAMKEAE